MYHGVSANDFDPPVWTQLPENIFHDQIKFINSYYNVLSLSQVISHIQSNREFPERSAMITFDDGLRNNYTVALPILKQYSVPATIFLTVDFIDSDKILWFDELLFYIKDIIHHNKSLEEPGIFDISIHEKRDLWDLYVDIVNKMKRLPEEERSRIMTKLREIADIDFEKLLIDFGMLTRDEVLEMERSGLVDFGTHTASHRILTNMRTEEWEKEIRKPRERLSGMLGKEVLSFCYPNGIPEIDFNKSHVEYLKSCGYVCAFSTRASLYEPGKDDPFRIGRIPAGNDFNSYRTYFRLACSGLM
jgi:peptidoglycan/xylan/chitin deacetylase (PgdA/CDA1 family)